MADNWNPGDIAKCINDDWHRMGDGSIPAGDHPVIGGEYMVTAYREIDVFRGLIVIPALSLIGFSHEYFADWFVKVQPRGEDRSVPEEERLPEHA